MLLSRLAFPALAFALAAALFAACGGGDDAQKDHPYVTSKAPKATIDVALADYSVQPSAPSVSAGPVRFVAKNTSAGTVHELAVLRARADGSFENAGEVEDIAPGTSGDITLDLPAGKYVLACAIVPGEAGSTIDHFKAGMQTPFEVR